VDLLLNPEIWIAFLTLLALEIVLGIDNVIFISILVDKLPEERQALARRLGLGLALIMRVLLLLSLSWVIGLTEPLFTVLGQEVSGRDLILILGGLFLLGTSARLGPLSGALLRGCANRRATVRTWQLSEPFHSLDAVPWHIRYSPIGASSKQPFEEVSRVNGGKGIYVGGTLISILISLALYATGRRESAIFVGLWAPTILNLGQSLLEED
jgi:Integral membrane protein TerC family